MSTDNSMLSYKIKNCLKCGATTTSDDEEEYFCSRCGSPVVNTCSNYECAEHLKGDAHYCKHCGSASIFKNSGILTLNTPHDDLPF